jgi:hypothetical protein
MAEALAVFGATASVIGVLDVLAKAIKRIHALRGTWKEADLIFMSLFSQLTALKSALTGIKEWMDNAAVEDAHYQLKIDLDMSVNCCKLLADRIEVSLAELQQTAEGSLDRLSKLKLVIGTTNMDDVQKMIDRQISALNLLLTACNW